ncbi:MAG: peroxiredoxin [Thermoleophilia bacterium]|nr:peroxiredoxin [Thermoleophilia bacterium]
MVAIGDQAPEFHAPSTEGPVRLADLLRDGPLVLYFFPRAMTSGCTAEALEFNQLIPEFAKLGVRVVGVSVDPLSRLERFRDKYELGFTLVSDQERSIGQAYGTLKQGHSPSHERDTFVISQRGQIILAYWRVKARGHASNVLDDLRRMSEAGQL